MYCGCRDRDKNASIDPFLESHTGTVMKNNR
jgi:hypothetical protein